MNKELNIEDVSVQALLGNLEEYIKQNLNTKTAAEEDKTTAVDKEEIQQAIIQLITGDNVENKVTQVTEDNSKSITTTQVNKDNLQQALIEVLKKVHYI